MDPEWLQGVLDVLIGLFRRIGLMANISKSQKVTCQPGAIRSVLSEDAVGWTEKYGERIYLQVTAAVLSDVTILWGGVDGGLNDNSLQAPVCNRSGD